MLKWLKHTTGNCAHTCVPWSGMMVNRTTPSSRRIQHIFPRDESDAVSSGVGLVSFGCPFVGRVTRTRECNGVGQVSSESHNYQ